jgi:hypothetical protein
MSSTNPVAQGRWLGRAAADSRSLLHWRARDRWLEGLMRFGQLARGFVYLLPGAFALRIALVSTGRSVDQKKAIASLDRGPLGDLLLGMLAIGLAGYSLWGLYRAVFDPLGRGHTLGGWMARIGYLGSALAYAGLLWFALQVINGSAPSEEATQQWIARALSHRFGSWAVIAVGLAWIAFAGLIQLWMALRARFMRDLDLARMGATEHAWALHMGRVGLAARAVVFVVIGISIVGAGLHLDPRESEDLGGALLRFLGEPFGRPLLTLVASGLITFGVYSILCVRWARLRVAESPAAPGVTARVT